MRADQLPSPRVNPAPAWLDDYHTNTGSPAHISAFGIQSGDMIWTSALNRNAAHLDVLSMSGCGSIGIVSGLTIVANTGLVVEILPGTALIGGVVQKQTATLIAVNASTTNFLWINRDGAFLVIDNSTAPPSGECCFLGTVTTNASSVTGIASYGVVKIQNGIATRTTTDNLKPSDTPPTNWRGFTHTANSVWYWNGSSYFRLEPELRPRSLGYLMISMPDSDYTLVESEQNASVVVLSGTLTATRNVVFPQTAGSLYFVLNRTNQSVVAKGATGAGVTIATNKSAVVLSDGTDYIRVTSDA